MLIWALTCCPTIATASSAALSGHRVLLLGDSLSAGYGIDPSQAWPVLMARQLPPHVTLHNASVSGETTAGGLQRLPTLLRDISPTVVIIELGGNDGLRGYPLGTIRENLLNLIKLCVDSNARVVLASMRIPPNYGRRYTAGFSSLFAELAQQKQQTLLPFLLDGIATQPDLMQEDGIHPNEKAQSLIVQNVLPVLLAVLD